MDAKALITTQDYLDKRCLAELVGTLGVTSCVKTRSLEVAVQSEATLLQ